jgi:ADP-ribosylglycohydrolase
MSPISHFRVRCSRNRFREHHKGAENIIKDKAMGMMFGLAIGDALGRPTEFMSLKNIHSKYGPDGIQDLPEQALYTDDTQMTIAITEALIKAGDKDLETIMDAVRDEFIKWRHSPENNRSPGNACLAGVSNMERGVHWSESGKPSLRSQSAILKLKLDIKNQE